MTALIIGQGEIGTSLRKALKNTVNIRDVIERYPLKKSYDMLFICFPYTQRFIQNVKEYQKKYRPKYTIIFSTVPPGTSAKLKAIHSPVEGMHPNLSKSIKTATRFLAGNNASEVADWFRRFGFKVYLFDKAETTELMKILSTTFYGVCIEYTKDVKKQCEKLGIPFEAWSIYTDMYNKLNKDLGFAEYTRPQLVPIMRKQGGHCVLPNCKLLKTVFTDLVEKLNNAI